MNLLVITGINVGALFSFKYYVIKFLVGTVENSALLEECDIIVLK